VLVIVVLVFGTKRLGNIGKDLGEAVKGFKKGMNDDEKDKPKAQLPDETRREETRRDETRRDESTTSQRDDSNDRTPR